MALVNCPECSKPVSDEAPVCIHCGYPLRPLARPGARMAWGFEWRTKAQLFGLPLVCVAVGRSAETGKLRVARGVIAIGQFAVGIVTIAQFGVGLLFGFGQFVAGSVVVAQFAGGLVFGLGQIATGYVAVGQFALGEYVRAQVAYGRYVWAGARQDPQAVAVFGRLWEGVKGLLGM
jgi:hypothetical protein